MSKNSELALRIADETDAVIGVLGIDPTIQHAWLVEYTRRLLEADTRAEASESRLAEVAERVKEAAAKIAKGWKKKSIDRAESRIVAGYIEDDIRSLNVQQLIAAAHKEQP